MEVVLPYFCLTVAGTEGLGRFNARYDFNGRFLSGVLRETVPAAGDSSLRSERRATF